jgi:hypothetical protein
MLNQNNFKSPICIKWKELSKLDFNYVNSITNKKSVINFKQFSDEILQDLKNKNVVVNGGHFIPNSDDYEDIGKNPIKTWILACKLVKHLKENEINAKISLMLNDIELTNDSRKKVFENHIHLPKKFEEILEKNKLSEKDVLQCCWNQEIIFTEKKLSNRIEHLIRRNKIDKNYEEADDYCVSALTMYYLDLIEQKIDVSIIIMPKCGWPNFERSIKLFTKLNKHKFYHIAYFETPNCFH